MALLSPDGTSITVRPVDPAELDRIVLRCWPDREIIDRLFVQQGTIGMAAWEGDKCVAQLHCYRVILPDGEDDDWPEWSRWDISPHEAHLGLVGPVWCHACCHVGRTLETYHREKAGPSAHLGTIRDGTDPTYFGRGIGTALSEASVRWAREHNYVAVLARGAPENLFEFAVWSGQLPWTTYARLGFETVAIRGKRTELPEWAKGNSPPEVMAQVRAALRGGRPVQDIRDRLMVLCLSKHARRHIQGQR